MSIKTFVFGPFQENTYILYDDTLECVIIDPGCYDPDEQQEVLDFIEEKELKPVYLLNTHSHIDHVCGNAFIHRKFNLLPIIHAEDLDTLRALTRVGLQYGFSVEASPEPETFIKEGDKITFGNTELEVFFTPGHSKGSVIYYNRQQDFVIGGDVLFYGSIGRTDLPGGNHNTLINSIKTKVFPLGNDVKIYSGHGPVTSIGFERMNNPFVK